MNPNSKDNLLFTSRLISSIVILGFLGLYLGLMINKVFGAILMILGVLFGFFGNLYLVIRDINKEKEFQ